MMQVDRDYHEGLSKDDVDVILDRLRNPAPTKASAKKGSE